MTLSVAYIFQKEEEEEEEEEEDGGGQGGRRRRGYLGRWNEFRKRDLGAGISAELPFSYTGCRRAPGEAE